MENVFTSTKYIFLKKRDFRENKFESKFINLSRVVFSKLHKKRGRVDVGVEMVEMSR